MQVATLTRQQDGWQLALVVTDAASDVAALLRTWQPQLAMYSRGHAFQLVLRINARAPAVTVDVVRRGSSDAGHVELLSCSISTQRGAPAVATRAFALTASFAQLLETVVREGTTAYAVAVEVLTPVNDD